MALRMVYSPLALSLKSLTHELNVDQSTLPVVSTHQEVSAKISRNSGKTKIFSVSDTTDKMMGKIHNSR